MTKLEMLNEIEKIEKVAFEKDFQFEFFKKKIELLKHMGVKRYYICKHHKKVDIEKYLEACISAVYDIGKRDELGW